MKTKLTLLLILVAFQTHAAHPVFKYGTGRQKKVNLYVTIGSIALGAGCNSMMDATNDHYYSSFLNKLDPHFWNHQVSWQYAPDVLGYRVDAWHISKSLMLFSLCVPAALFLHENYPILKSHPFWDRALWWTICGTTWTVVFDSGYKYL